MDVMAWLVSSFILVFGITAAYVGTRKTFDA